jgi:hypothetical protein
MHIKVNDVLCNKLSNETIKILFLLINTLVSSKYKKKTCKYTADSLSSLKIHFKFQPLHYFREGLYLDTGANRLLVQCNQGVRYHMKQRVATGWR